MSKDPVSTSSVLSILARCKGEPLFKELLTQAGSQDLSLVGGAAGSYRSICCASLLENRPGLVLLEDLQEAEFLADDLHLLLGPDRVFMLPPRELRPYDSKHMPLEKRSELMEILRRLRFGESLVLVACARQLATRYPRRDVFDRGIYNLETGMELDRQAFIDELGAAGYSREVAVEDIAQFSVRGGILDFYPWGLEYPLRLEFFGDEIESIRAFDPSSQTSTEHFPGISVVISSGEQDAYDQSLFELLREDTLFICPPRDELREHLDQFARDAAGSWSSLDAREGILSPDHKYIDPPRVIEDLSRRPRVVFHPSRLIDDEAVNFRSRRQESFLRNLDLLFDNIRSHRADGHEVHILCDNNGQLERLREILEESGFPAHEVRLSVGSLHQGFVSHDAELAVFTDHEIFGRPRSRRSFRRFKRATALRKIENLEPGDAVVHVRFGIGIFEGLTRITVHGVEREVLKIRYSNDDRIYVRLEHFRDVVKYSGQEGAEPKLSRLGTGEWERVKSRTKKSIKNIARELVELYARRRMSRGYSTGRDTVWQKEMEAAFEFEETSHQLESITAVKEDMEAGWPMDRLICGDVGFGKTEVAVRAAFKSVCDGKQAAVLVPTTILAQQHYNTFSARFAEFPVGVEVLSRFRTRQEQRQVLADLKRGKVDVIIGTHRLLSRDVDFKDLGLLVVDEEQRFGVMHKERIKQLRANLDVITMTATPIPRTLDMALLGIKDLSLVNEPPSNRLPIETEIVPYNKTTIRTAVMRELDRNGQVYFVHNRVQTIDTMRSMLVELVPEARFAVAHGQMREKSLERVMLQFMRREYDVLVSTMIIETGLDIPNVNTMIVNRADAFGLAQLYQLRGRIGRSHRQAYAYLLTPTAFAMKPDAKKRLFTIGEFTDLGSGFKIAMRDLEIRGAGNILGAEQSGFINAVGYELYNRLLEESIAEIKAEDELKDEEGAQRTAAECRVELPMDALLPADYVEDPGERVNLYRRLQQTDRPDELDELRAEVADRFGNPPREALMLFYMVELQKMGRVCGLIRVDMRDERLRLVPLQEGEDDGARFLAALKHLDQAWGFEIHGEPELALVLGQQGLDWIPRIEQARKLLRELSPRETEDSNARARTARRRKRDLQSLN